MMQDKSFSISQLTAVLDNAPTAIYVSALENFELLYANRQAESLFLRRSESKGAACYEAAGFNKPCPFCHIENINSSGLMVREFFDSVNNRYYELSGKIIDWAGIPAHIEYITDITDKKRKYDRDEAWRKGLETIFDSIPCGLCVYRYEEERFLPLYHNKAFYEIMGYSEEHISSVERETDFLGVHPEDIALLKNKIMDVLKCNGTFQHTYRVWNDRQSEYRHIRLEGASKSREDGTLLLYGVYSDVSGQIRLEKELEDANREMQDIVNAIPGGIAIYRVSDILETIYFSDGLPEICGYTAEEYSEIIRRDAAEIVCQEDLGMVMSKMREIINSHGITKIEFRRKHREGRIVWVRVQMKWIGEENGCPLVHCVFHNVTDLKETQLELDHLVNSIPGGIASYLVEKGKFIPAFFSDGVPALSGHTREELEEIARDSVSAVVYEQDRERVLTALTAAMESGGVLDVSYRMRHKDGNLVWIHLNGRRMGPLTDNTRFYAVFTGMSAETRLFQSIANETADGIYVIDKENYDLLYANETQELFMKEKNSVGRKCYEALHGKDSPCAFCTLKSHSSDGEEHEMITGQSDRFYATRFRETDWNGIKAYVKYVRDITQEVTTRREKERLEQYFQTVVKNLPGGVAVVHCEKNGTMKPEYLSDGFARLTGMTPEEAWVLYQQDAMSGVHPEDRKIVNESMEEYIASGRDHCEIIYRLKYGTEGYIWVKNTLSMIQDESGENRVYAFYHDITKEREEQAQVRQKYNSLIVQHYRTPGPDALVAGHCNITKNIILEIIDYTDSSLLESFGNVREEFFLGLSSLIVDEKERQVFLDTYLNAPSLAAFKRNETEQILRCYIRLPREARGRYAQFQMNLIDTPDSGDVTGILTVTDVTEQTIADRILHQMPVANCDFIVDADLEEDVYTVLIRGKAADDIPERRGRLSERIAYILSGPVVQKDRKRVAQMLDVKYMQGRLRREGTYSFPYSVAGEKGDILTKSLTVSAVDLRLGRICLTRTDVTDSIREQQGLLNMLAYTFELACLITITNKRFTMHTRQTVLENLPPFTFRNYSASIERFAEHYKLEEGKEKAREQFYMETILRRLEEKPSGYDFVFACQTEEGLRYKQVNVLWGDENHRTICMVRADVTDMLATEQQVQKALEKALAFAEEANQAKSDFLSAMSHDIRTPMNAIMGMTELATAYIGDSDRVADCLRKISVSSRHLLSLINDVLDMSKIERSNITLNHTRVCLPELLEQLTAMLAPQARSAGIQFHVRTSGICHDDFYGDSLRINQILINILSNAIKFTPDGGTVELLTEEIMPTEPGERVRYRFTVRDTGIGMPQELLSHVFEPFTRGQAASKIEGTGLGLSITKGLVEQMKGDISVESKEGKGSTFLVELEFREAQPKEKAESRRNGISEKGTDKEKTFAGRCFLVAEDNEINSEILCELLAIFGAETVIKTDGVQAVQAFRDAVPGTYAAVLMDIQMPEMNGYEATRAIRGMEREDAKKIPIVAMTANAFAEDVQAALNAGMNAHVAKPIDIDVLILTLNRVLDTEQEEMPEKEEPTDV